MCRSHLNKRTGCLYIFLTPRVGVYSRVGAYYFDLLSSNSGSEEKGDSKIKGFKSVKHLNQNQHHYFRGVARNFGRQLRFSKQRAQLL